MNYSNSFEYINSKLDERRIEIEQHLGRGTAFDDYQKLCGIIQGLDFAKQVVEDLAKRMETDDDE
jgi:hypothetical protein